MGVLDQTGTGIIVSVTKEVVGYSGNYDCTTSNT
jgi:hypothetical protein